MRSFTVDDRRRRLGRRHCLAEPAPDVESVVDAMVVLHATDPATVYLAAIARLAEPSIDAVAAALYDDRTLVRVLAMRSTLFVAKTEDVALIERSSTDAVAAAARKRLAGFLAEAGIDDPTTWLADAATEIAVAVPAEGVLGRGVADLVPRLRTKIVMGAGTKHVATAAATSRTLAVLANEGLLVRGRPAGAWTSRQYRWHLRVDWLGAAAPEPDSLGLVEASGLLVERWLRCFGPATYDDVKWWTGWKAAQLKAALERLDLVEVDLHGRPGLVLADDEYSELDDGLLAPQTDEPWVSFLPSLDPTPMGWKERDWYLGPYRPELFDQNGNVGPTIWLDGRIIGGWSQQPDGEIVMKFLEDVGANAKSLAADESARLSAMIGDTVVKPSFPTPLQRELSCE